MSGNIQRPISQNLAPVATTRPAMVSPAMMPGQNMGMTPKEIAGILRRHLWLIISFTTAGLILGGAAFVLLQRLAPKYTSNGAIEVLPNIEDPVWAETAIQPNKDTYYQFRFTKASLVKQQNMLMELLRQDKILATDWFKKFAKVDAQGQIIGGRDEAIKKAFKQLNSDLNSNAPRDFNYIQLSMSCKKPGDAKVIVDEMIRIYLANQRQIAIGSYTDELVKLSKQRNEIKGRIDQINQTLDDFRKGTRFAKINMGQNNFRDYMDETMTTLENDYKQLNSEKSRLESQIAILKTRAESEEYDKVIEDQVEQDPIAQQMRATIAALEPDMESKLVRFGENHRLVREAQARLDQARKDLNERKKLIGDVYRKSNYEQANDQLIAHTRELQTSQEQLNQKQADYKEIDKVRSDYAKYEIQKEEQQRLLEEVNKLIEGMNVQVNDPKISKLIPLGEATEPIEMSFPNLKLFLPGGFMLGLMTGLGLAFLLELSNDMVRTPSDVMRHLRTPLLGSICHMEDDNDIEGLELSHVVRQAPYSIMSEGYRQFRTNLRLAKGSSEQKAILITSPEAGDGKTTVATNLASTLIAESKKVVIVDANFRRPRTGFLFGKTTDTDQALQLTDYGLSNYLMGQCASLEEIVRSSGIESLDVIDSGPLPSNPAEILSSSNMLDLIEQLKLQYDQVIIDGPPMIVSDAKTLASIADGTIVVFNAEQTHRGMALRILRELREIDANTIGTILMGVKSRKGGYFQEVYRSYQEYQRVPVKQAT